MDAKMVEIVARAIHDAPLHDGETIVGMLGLSDAQCHAIAGDAVCTCLAQAAITALTEAGMIVPEGCVAVPVEPTDAMIKAGRISWNLMPGAARVTTWATNRWAAMPAAAKEDV